MTYSKSPSHIYGKGLFVEFVCVSDGSRIQASFLLANHFHLSMHCTVISAFAFTSLRCGERENDTRQGLFLMIERRDIFHKLLCLVKNTSYAGKGVILSWSSCAGRCSGLFLDVLIQPLIANGMCLFLIVSPLTQEPCSSMTWTT